MDVFQSLGNKFDRRLDARIDYEGRVASRTKVLDIGGRNDQSTSFRRLRELSSNPESTIVSTDVIAHYKPDIVDDICNSSIRGNSFPAIYCEAVLEHVANYEAAIANIHRILEPGGEVFFYVPFFFCFHDEMDYHRFTFSEADRMLRIFGEHRIFLSDWNGYGGVIWQLLTFYRIQYYPRLWACLAEVTNRLLGTALRLKFALKPSRSMSKDDYIFFYTHLFVNHGFGAWARK